MLQVWLCGGSMEVLPCSRVAHIERKKKPYNNNIGFYTKRNALRVAEVWMDDYKWHVYIAWNLPLEVQPHLLLKPELWSSSVPLSTALTWGLSLSRAPWALRERLQELQALEGLLLFPQPLQCGSKSSAWTGLFISP